MDVLIQVAGKQSQYRTMARAKNLLNTSHIQLTTALRSTEVFFPVWCRRHREFAVSSAADGHRWKGHGGNVGLSTSINTLHNILHLGALTTAFVSRRHDFNQI